LYAGSDATGTFDSDMKKFWIERLATQDLRKNCSTDELAEVCRNSLSDRPVLKAFIGGSALGFFMGSCGNDQYNAAAAILDEVFEIFGATELIDDDGDDPDA